MDCAEEVMQQQSKSQDKSCMDIDKWAATHYMKMINFESR